ncbi:formate dehydrogenase accessory protein FdhE [Insolitispirillum peregrinum]|uniref:formate dehydrogenase accessory protein FdhE n=1 Tax=Insolitispirillum peregrinum TaxID=80876 RepID=UPI003611F19C
MQPTTPNTASPDLHEAMAEAGLKPGRSPVPVLLPAGATVFRVRAERLRTLAREHPLQDWLEFVALISDAQADVSARDLPQGVEDSPATAWLDDFAALTAGIKDLVPAPAQQALAENDPQDIHDIAARLLEGRLKGQDLALAPFIVAALQVAWTRHAASQKAEDIHVQSREGGCPVCGSAPVASMIHIGMESGGLRYLHCSLCNTAWHHVRTTCVACGQDKGLSYRLIEELGTAVRAETCDCCHSYLKQVMADKAPGAEPLADDLAMLALDILLAEDGYQPLGVNPFLLLADEPTGEGGDDAEQPDG